MINSIENHIRTIWKSFYTAPQNILEESTKLEDYPLTRYLEMSGITILNSNLYDLSINYLSDNSEENVGFNKALFLKEGLLQMTKNLIPSQRNYSSIVTPMFIKIFDSWTPEELKTMRIVIAGLRVNHPERGIISIINNACPSHWNEAGRPTKSIYMLQDISYLMKDDNYWIKIWSDVSPEKTVIYHSNTDLYIKDDILTRREKEILKLIIKGKNPDEIALELSISRVTVNNHRQKVLDKMSVRDTTALINLSKLIGFSLWGNES